MKNPATIPSALATTSRRRMVSTRGEYSPSPPAVWEPSPRVRGGPRRGMGMSPTGRFDGQFPRASSPRIPLMSDTAPDPSTARRRLTVVYNPLRVDDLDAAKTTVGKACAEQGWSEPSWIETTAEETGEKQAREAVQAGADVVASLGGDGTVRAVASALVGTDVALGLLPGGTGNLLARNLGLPVGELDDAVRTVVQGHDRRIDVGVVRLCDELPEPESSHATKESPPAVADDEEIFLVMTGLGLDGEIMADTDEKLKEKVGWLAYIAAAAKKLSGRGFPVEVRSGGGEGVVGAPRRSVSRTARAV